MCQIAKVKLARLVTDENALKDKQQQVEADIWLKKCK
jgi:hypothetical protein